MIEKEINYREDLKYVPHHKIGIKILDVPQLENLFPNYESLLQRIDQHREKLQQMEKIEFEKDSQYNLMYDNIFSIFGKRGAGKTSAMFTLKTILETRCSQDIVFPIVMPEMIPKECSMIGWILSLLEDIVDELDHKMREKLKMNYTEYEECMHRQRNSLKREYEKVKELCFSQFYQTEWTESFSTALMNKERQTQNSFNFSRRLGKFWDLFKETIQKTSSDKKTKEPLIYIIFDDVDLLPEAVTMLLSTIIKYLSHPNIIVFVTADEELLYDVIENNMNENMGKYKELEMYSSVARIYPNGSFGSVQSPYYQEIRQKLRRACQIPRLYADKVLPPSSRYYLKTYETYEDKSLFIERVEQKVEKGEISEKQITLQDLFISEIDRYIKEVGASCPNFLIDDKGRFVKAYFAFWGNTSRQLVNEALILHEFITRLIGINKSYKKEEYSKEKYSKLVFECIFDFAYNSLTAMGSSELNVEEIKELLEELIVSKTGKWDIYLNYSYLRERAEEKNWSDNNPEKNIQQTICISILLFFLENILVIESKSNPGIPGNQRQKIHGRGILVDMLDQVTMPGESLICKNQARDIKEFLLFYEKILVAPETLRKFDLMKSRRVRNYLNKLSMDKVEVSLSKYSRENPKWLRSISKILYFSNEGIYEIQKSDLILRKLNNPTYAIYDAYFEESLRDLRDDLVKALTSIPEKFENRWKRVRQISSSFEQDYVSYFMRRLDNSKKTDKKFSNLKEIAKEAIEQTLKMQRGNNEFIRIDAYKRIEQSSNGKAARTLALLNELETVSDRILNNYNDFKQYQIVDIERFGQLIKSLERFNIAVPRNIEWRMQEILIADMNKIFRDITNEMAKLDLDQRYRNPFLYQDNFKSPLDLQDVYEELCNCVTLNLKSAEDLERAISIVIDTQQFKTLQKFYLWSYLELQKEKPGDMRIDYTSIPHSGLYTQIRNELKKNDGGYLSQLLRRYIEEAVAAYLDMLMEG